ncbi:ABC transporter permease [Streptomyces cadmiisoli]|uniref:ABC transporter permease n=1 Tax=Streptomyces cadmiisoli TaxID=2184053 RepID=A0A2Z4J7C9_9ACTN|nr:ABC transporter permease [Streptomyces cadmiisoli]AWW40870.1 ABC transporter permease [Streptomyces cadmiisoli]
MSSPPRNGTRHVFAVAVLVPLIATLALCAFAWPSARTAPRDLPLGVAGPAAAAAQVEAGLTREKGAFEIHRYDDKAAAREAVEDRSVYGAIVVTADGTELLTASAAGPAVAQALRTAVADRAAAEGAEIRIVDVVPTPEADPRGTTLSSSVLPLVLAGTAAGAMVALAGLRGGRAVTALVAASGLVGVGGTLIAHTWLEGLTGDRWAEAAVFALASLAVSSAVAGLAALMGQAGVAVVATTMMLLGNPFSAAGSAPPMLPEPAGTIGQLLPPGAGVSLLRSVAFFDGAGASGPLLTLGVWTVLGLSAMLVGGALRRRATAGHGEPARAPMPVAVG